MEEYAVTYEKIALNGYQIEHILSLEMQENVNDHGKLHLTAVISEELAEQYVYTTTPMMPVTLSYQSDNGMTPLCHGIVTEIQVNCQGNTYYMDLEVKGKTYAMDIVEHSRSFQKTSMTVHQLIKEVMSGYDDYDCIIQIPDEQIQRLVVQ